MSCQREEKASSVVRNFHTAITGVAQSSWKMSQEASGKATLPVKDCSPHSASVSGTHLFHKVEELNRVISCLEHLPTQQEWTGWTLQPEDNLDEKESCPQVFCCQRKGNIGYWTAKQEMPASWEDWLLGKTSHGRQGRVKLEFSGQTTARIQWQTDRKDIECLWSYLTKKIEHWHGK